MKPLKEYKVTLHPKPVTFTVHATGFMQAIGIAEHNYSSGDIQSYGFENVHVREQGELLPPPPEEIN